MRTPRFAAYIITVSIPFQNQLVYKLIKFPRQMCLIVSMLIVSIFPLSDGGYVFAQGMPLSPAQSCKEFLAAKRSVNGDMIGQEDCRMRETVVTDDTWPEVAEILDLEQGKRYRRVEIGLTGTLAGYSVRSGPRPVHFTSAPEIVFPQSGNETEPEPGILRYDMYRGASMSLMFPEDGSWNGKLFLTLPGSDSYRYGTIVKWDHNYDPEDPMGDVSRYHKLILSKGYALAMTRRNHNNRQKGDGDYAVRLLDGTVLLDRNPVDNPELIIGYAQVAQELLASRDGRKPTRTYWYGHSGGARKGKLVNYNNYFTSANIGPDGQPIIDGILVDDSGAGLWLPQVFRNGEDILFRTEADRAPFVPQLEVAHQLYMNDRNDPVPDWVSTSFQINKYRNAQLLRDKGLSDKFRFYEVRGVSHSGGESMPTQVDSYGLPHQMNSSGTVQVLPIWRLMDGFIDMLDAWVDRRVVPPPTRSDWAELGDADRDGIVENGALALPEVACPLGVYYPFPPPSGSKGSTAFVAFDGNGEEPFDGRAIERDEEEDSQFTLATFADMNLNGYRDFRETVTQAWQRLGILQHNESFSRERYMSCVQQTVEELEDRGFISGQVGEYYVEQASTGSLPDWVR